MDQETQSLVEISVGDAEIRVLVTKYFGFLSGFTEVIEAQVMAVDEVLVLVYEARRRRIWDFECLNVIYGGWGAVVVTIVVDILIGRVLGRCE